MYPHVHSRMSWNFHRKKKKKTCIYALSCYCTSSVFIRITPLTCEELRGLIFFYLVSLPIPSILSWMSACLLPLDGTQGWIRSVTQGWRSPLQDLNSPSLWIVLSIWSIDQWHRHRLPRLWTRQCAIRCYLDLGLHKQVSLSIVHKNVT